LRRHHRGAYRSGLEDGLAEFLEGVQQEVRYEKLKIEWEDLKYRLYTPDYELDNGIIIEAKGLFTPDDRRKHLEIKKQHPELDIRFVFSNAKAKLNKGAKTRYFEWCEKNNFLWSHRIIPKEWLQEPGVTSSVTRIPLKTERRK
jgi:hypothetical protein